MIKIYEPYKISNSSEKVKKAIDNGNLTFQNVEFDDIRKKLTSLHHGVSTIPVFNGTCATHLAFKIMKMKLPKLKKIIVPNNVYVAAWNSMLMDGEIELIPIDADDLTWCVDINLLSDEISKSNPEETGILIVHNLGGIVNVPSLIRKFPYHTFIEDNCEGFLGKYENKLSGTASLASSISFYANKTITCGEGGALISNSNFFDEICRLQSQGQTKTRYVHDIVAYNYRMTNIQSIMLLSQFELIDEILLKKKKIFETYKQELSKSFEFQKSENNTKHSGWMTSIRLRGRNYHSDIEKLITTFETRPMFYPMSAHNHLKKFSNKKNEIVSSLLSKECFMIPSHPNLNENELEIIIKTLNGIAQ